MGETGPFQPRSDDVGPDENCAAHSELEIIKNPISQGDALGYFVAPLPGVGTQRALLPDEPFFARPAVNGEKQQRACCRRRRPYGYLRMVSPEPV